MIQERKHLINELPQAKQQHLQNQLLKNNNQHKAIQLLAHNKINLAVMMMTHFQTLFQQLKLLKQNLHETSQRSLNLLQAKNNLS